MVDLRLVYSQSPGNSYSNPFLPVHHESPQTPEEEFALHEPQRLDEPSPGDSSLPVMDFELETPDNNFEKLSRNVESNIRTSVSSPISSEPRLDAMCDAVAEGNIADVIKYFSLDHELTQGNHGKSIFHAAAINCQTTAMQVFLNLGCPIFISDVANYVGPAIEVEQVTVDLEKYNDQDSYQSLAESVNRWSKNKGDETFRTYTEYQRTPVRPIEYHDPLGDSIHYRDFYEWENRNRSYRPSVVLMRKEGFSSSSTSAVIHPYDPEGVHHDLQVYPDYEALHKSIRRGDSLLEIGYHIFLSADLNWRDKDMLTPLDIAVDLRNIPAIQELIDRGADPDVGHSVMGSPYERALRVFQDDDLQNVEAILANYHQNTVREKFQRHKQSAVTQKASWDLFLGMHGFREQPSQPKVDSKSDLQTDNGASSFDSDNNDFWLQDWQIYVPHRARWFLELWGYISWYKEPIGTVVDDYSGQSFELEGHLINFELEGHPMEQPDHGSWLPDQRPGSPSGASQSHETQSKFDVFMRAVVPDFSSRDRSKKKRMGFRFG